MSEIIIVEEQVEVVVQVTEALGIVEIVAGENVTVDNTNPLRPIVSASGSVESQTAYLGTIYKNNTWSDLSDFTNSTTANIVSNKINLSGGANTTTQHLEYNYFTSLERYSFSSRIKITTKDSTSYGVGIGVASTGTLIPWSNYLKFDSTSGGSGGFLTLFMGNEPTAVATSPTALSFSANDYIDLTLIREQDKFTCIVRNVTTESTEISFTYNCPTSSIAKLLHNTGRFAHYNFGGTFTIDSIEIVGREIKNANLLLIGDSKTVGYNSTNFNNRFASKLSHNISSLVVSSGVGDGTQDVLNRISEIIALSPKMVLMCGIGRNDLANSIGLPTTQANYTSIVNQLEAVGIKVIHVNSFYETLYDLSTFSSWIEDTYTDSVIDTFTPLSTTAGTVSGDTVHLTDLANDIIYRTILNSPLLKGQNTIINDIIRIIEEIGGLFYLDGDKIKPKLDSQNLYIGSDAAPAAVSNPKGKLSLGTEFSSVSNNPVNAKLILLDTGDINNYGFSVSYDHGVEYFGGAGGLNKHTFFGNVIIKGLVRLQTYTVGTLPAGVLGDTACVSDALTPTYLGIAVGGGAVKCKVFHNGVNWIT